MEQIRLRRHETKKDRSFDGLTLKSLGWLFTVAGVIALSLFPADSMAATKMTMLMLSYLAMPIFAFLLVEGFLHTSDLKKYLLTMLVSALAAELFYNYACSGAWFAYAGDAGQNPMFALVLGLVMLYFLRYIGDGSFGKVLGKLVVVVAAVLWSVMLNIRYGVYMVIVTALFYLLRGRKVIYNTVISLISFPWYITPEIALLITSNYNGTRVSYNKYLFYAGYPALWFVAAIAKMILL